MQHTENERASSIDDSLWNTLQRWSLSWWSEEEDQNAISFVEQRTAQLRHGQTDTRILNSPLPRYIRLLDIARSELRHLFSDDELVLMVSAVPNSVWGPRYDYSPSEVIFAWPGIDDLHEDGREERRLQAKLLQLTPLQQVALLDTLECAWRKAGPLEYVQQVLGGDSASPAYSA